MRRKLEPRWKEALLKLPESGMGYQCVDVRLADGRELNNVNVFNAEIIDLPDEFADAQIEDIYLHAPTSKR